MWNFHRCTPFWLWAIIVIPSTGPSATHKFLWSTLDWTKGWTICTILTNRTFIRPADIRHRTTIKIFIRTRHFYLPVAVSWAKIGTCLIFFCGMWNFHRCTPFWLWAIIVIPSTGPSATHKFLWTAFRWTWLIASCTILANRTFSCEAEIRTLASIRIFSSITKLLIISITFYF